MTRYSLFSRQSGWKGSSEVRHFKTGRFKLRRELADQIFGFTGSEILAMKSFLWGMPEDLIESCRIYGNWYLYREDQTIGAMEVD